MKRFATLLVVGVVAVIVLQPAVGGGMSRRRQATAAQRPFAVPARSIAALRLVKQAYRNNCETAALSMLLSAAGVRVDQRVLQRRIRHSRPLDPIERPDGSWTWGDPDKGFVGRVDGGGLAGGFGVYDSPIQRLALRYRVRLRNLTRRDLSVILQSLRDGRPVLTWIGLSAGPYRRWKTPAGRKLSVNFGEHTVVLVGLRGGMILVNDPLTGRRVNWSVQEFDSKWKLLGRRALAL